MRERERRNIKNRKQLERKIVKIRDKAMTTQQLKKQYAGGSLK
jgi:hypothetical protein